MSIPPPPFLLLHVPTPLSRNINNQRGSGLVGRDTSKSKNGASWKTFKWTPATKQWEKQKLGLGRPAFRKQNAKLPQTEEAWEQRLVKELDKGVGTWSRRKGEGFPLLTE